MEYSKGNVLEIKIGSRMRALRMEADITQQELGELTGIERSTIAAYEADERKPTAYIAARIAKALNVSLDYLCALTNDRYTIRIPKEVEIDLNRLNYEGINKLCNYYRMLCNDERYAEVHENSERNTSGCK